MMVIRNGLQRVMRVNTITWVQSSPACFTALPSRTCNFASVGRLPFGAPSDSILVDVKPGGAHQLCQSNGFFIARCLLASMDITVQQMGESITEGTVAAILKKAGDTVAEDEVVFQIETDKVTIDVRAPKAGVLESLLVKEEDTVVVGQPVAKLSTDATGARQTAASTATQPQPEASVSLSSAYQPSINFPPRVTPDGLRISDLPAMQVNALKQTAPQKPPPLPSQPTVVIRSDKAPPPPPKPMAPFRKTVSVVDRIPRRTLSEKEMAYIELGGAEP